MTTPQDITEQHHDQLAQQRAHARLLLGQIAAQGGLASARQDTLRALAEVHAGIAVVKDQLRASRVVVDDLPEDTVNMQANSVEINNSASNHGTQGYFEKATFNTFNAPAIPKSSLLTPSQRTELLDRLALHYQELLNQTLAHQVGLQLGLHTRPDVVDLPLRRIHLRTADTSQTTPLGTSVCELLDKQSGQLLVLGAPDAGKTTLFVELALSLTKTAQQNGHARMPVLLNLASWRSGQKLRDWLAQAVREAVWVSVDIDDLIILLDGLDKVAESHRVACVSAINAYLAESTVTPSVVVSCRSREYAEIRTKLQITQVIELKPLDLATVEQALVGVSAAQGVLAALHTDTVLCELARTPLIINVLLLAYGGQAVPPSQVLTLEERRMTLWWAYVRRMLVKQGQVRWASRQVLWWLRWLASTLREQSKIDFLIDDLQKTTLSSILYRGLYVLCYGLVFGLCCGLPLGLGGALFFGPHSFNEGLIYWLGRKLFEGLMFWLFIGLAIVPTGLIIGLTHMLSSEQRHRAPSDRIGYFTLSFLLWRAGLFPFRAATFLNTMTKRLLLEHDGAFYRFRHLLLRDFIADLSDDDIARLAREIDGEGVQG